MRAALDAILIEAPPAGDRGHAVRDRLDARRIAASTTTATERTTQCAIVVAPDSFKGLAHRAGQCARRSRAVCCARCRAAICQRPMADGGEGTLDAVLDRGRRGGPAMHGGCHLGAGGASTGSVAKAPVERDEGTTAVIEVAQVVGITDAAGMAVPVGRAVDAWRRRDRRRCSTRACVAS